MKHIWYIKGTTTYGLEYVRSCEEDTVIDYTNNDLARVVIEGRSTSSISFYLNENLVTWASQK